jgi:hypothetical protein
MVAFSKPHKLGLVVLTNQQGNIASGTIAFEALEMQTAEAKKETRPESPQPTPTNLKPLMGRYLGMRRLASSSTLNAAMVRLIPTPPTPLLATDKPEVFMIQAGRWAGEPLPIECDSNGRVSGFQMSADAGRFRKID